MACYCNLKSVLAFRNVAADANRLQNLRAHCSVSAYHASKLEQICGSEQMRHCIRQTVEIAVLLIHRRETRRRH